MSVLTGLEKFQILGQDGNNMPAATTFTISTMHLAYLATATKIATATNTAGFTLVAATQEAGAPQVFLNLTGTLGAGANVQSDTAAAIQAAMPGGTVAGIVIGQSYRLRIINASSANFAWTLTTNTGVTLTGTMSIAQNTWRDFVVTLTAAGAVTITSVGTGTNS